MQGVKDTFSLKQEVSGTNFHSCRLRLLKP